jgi:hypothetical protein
MAKVTEADLSKMSPKEIADFVAKLSAERDSAVQAAQRSLTLKVSEKGGVSLCGLGKWPVTLYADQWSKVLSMSSQIAAFIEANKAALNYKK